MHRSEKQARGVSSHRRESCAFTLIEVLVVVAIIAIMVSILLPSLARAREQARTVRCLSNMSNLPKAVLAFAQEHRGYAQALAEGYKSDFSQFWNPLSWEIVDPQRTRYDYQQGLTMGPITTSDFVLKAWPVAYAKYVGHASLRRMEQYCDARQINDPSYYRTKYGFREIFTCPSDDELVRDMWSPGKMFGLLSYGPSEDVFGLNKGFAWRGTNGTPEKADQLQGKMDYIRRPAEVLLFCDAGNEWKKAGRVLVRSDPAYNTPFLESFELNATRLPHERHSKDGGLSVGFADGSGRYAKPLDWMSFNGRKYVKRYTPRIRVSPYEVGRLRSTTP